MKKQNQRTVNTPANRSATGAGRETRKRRTRRETNRMDGAIKVDRVFGAHQS